jgi:hypothetical protein
MEMLRAALATGRAHLVNAEHWPTSREPLSYAAQLGWRGHVRAKGDPETGPRYEPLGELIGYVEGTRDEVWLIPDAATASSRGSREIRTPARLRTQARLGALWWRKGI